MWFGVGVIITSIYFATIRRNGLSKDLMFLFLCFRQRYDLEGGVGAPFFIIFLFPTANCIDRPNMLDRDCRIGTKV